MALRDLYLITIGFILVGLGLALLTFREGGTFIIFPFFFTGNLAPFLMISALFVVMIFFWWVNRNWLDDARFSQTHRPEYLRVGTICKYCGSPLPENAVYCPSCGKSVEDDFSDNVSF